jgi:hypothetical protein
MWTTKALFLLSTIRKGTTASGNRGIVQFISKRNFYTRDGLYTRLVAQGRTEVGHSAMARCRQEGATTCDHLMEFADH